jgi:hypothetical protein
MTRSQTRTLRLCDVIQAVSEVAANEDETLAAIVHLLRGCPETKALKNSILCHVLGKTKNGITGSAVSCHAFSKV